MYLYSNIIGTFVLNQNFKIREKILFKEDELLKNYALLKEGKQLESEKAFLDRFKDISNLREEKNEKAMNALFQELEPFKQLFYSNNLLLTKLQIRDSVTEDLLIIQAINSVDETKKAINLLSKRLREWYSYILPELEEKIEDHKKLAELITESTRSELIKEFSIKNTMGKDLSKADTEAVTELANSIKQLFKQKDDKEKYLETLMKKTCPNMTAVAGSLIGAKLISIGGSLRKLVMMPSSTIQLLGAEKALFKHMLNKSNVRPPKHGEIINHPLVMNAPKDQRGKRARALADKILLAVKLDYFKGEFLGDKIRKELEEKFK